MNILSKMINRFVFVTLAIVIVSQIFCIPSKKNTHTKEGSFAYIYLLYSFERNLNEPNNSFDEAKCIIVSGYLKIYPESDVDFFKFETTDNNINLFIGDYQSFVSQYNLGFQIFNNSRILIYDINDPSFEATNSNIIVNKTLTQSECLIESCIPLTSYRYLEFSSNIKQIYIKSYAFNEANYFEQTAIRIDSQSNRNRIPLDPRKLPSSLGSYNKNIFISNYSSECTF